MFIRVVLFWCVGTFGSVTATGSDIDNPRVVEDPVYYGMGNGGVSQCIAPLLKANTGGDD